MTTRVTEHAPSPALRAFVRQFLVVEFPGRHDDRHLPDTSPVAAFSIRGDCRLEGGAMAPRAAFTGIRDTLRTHQHRDRHAVVITRFTPAGAAAVLRVPMQEFATATVHFGDVLPLGSLIDQLDSNRPIDALEAFLRNRIRDVPPDPLATAAAALLERTYGAVRIRGLATQLGISQSALERRFRHHVGISPKRFAEIVRLRRAISLHRAGSDLTTAARRRLL